MRAVLWVATGGAAGSVLRYVISDAINQRSAPWGTLAVNLVGSFALGLLIGWYEARSADSMVRLALSVGVLGGFTTFSAWAAETVDLLNTDRVGLAFANVALSLAGGLLAAAIGLMAGRSI